MGLTVLLRGRSPLVAARQISDIDQFLRQNIMEGERGGGIESMGKSGGMKRMIEEGINEGREG